MAKYRIFTKPKQVKKAITKAEKENNKIALAKLKPLKKYKFVRVKKVKVYY